jgi:ubiquitin-like 1-activating enzyme E1 A
MAEFIKLTASEQQRYDRQIRVWGAEAQSRIQTSKVLVCGLSKLNIEVTKNIILAGMSVTIQDSGVVTEDDLSCNFFVDEGDLGKDMALAVLPRVKELNPFATIQSETKQIQELPDSYFAQFNVILITNCTESEAIRINKICRSQTPQSIFFWSDVFGEESIFYSDFGDVFEYKDDPKPASAESSSSSSSSSSVQPAQAIKTLSFPAIDQVLGRKWKDITSRHFPLSPTYVKHRILTMYKSEHGGVPMGIADSDKLAAILARCQTENGVGSVESSILSEDDLQRLCVVASTVNVMTCSVTGSYLSQEVIKAVSKTGCPALNVFVFSALTFTALAFPVLCQ